MKELVMDRRARLWAYGVTAAALAVGGVYGVLTGTEIAAWMGLASAVFGLAIVNVPSAEGK